MASSMEELSARFKSEAFERYAEIEVLLDSLPSAADPAAICDVIRDHAHKLKGAAGVFGFGEMKDAASALEEEAASQAAASDGETAYGAVKPAADALGEFLPE